MIMKEDISVTCKIIIDDVMFERKKFSIELKNLEI